MHIEILVEDASGEKLLDAVLPKLLGEQGDPHTWRVHSYKGIGRIPKNLKPGTDANKRILLDRLPAALRGYGKTPGIDAVVVVLDSDRRDCTEFLAELKALAAGCNPAPNTMFRLAIEEVGSLVPRRPGCATCSLSTCQGGRAEPLRAGQRLRHLGAAGRCHLSRRFRCDQKGGMAVAGSNQMRVGAKDWPLARSRPQCFAQLRQAA